MSAAPSFSIITPAYNAARFLPRCHWSLTRQTIADWEWIVVDDGSTDGTRELIAGLGDERIRYHRLEENQGRGPARNHALQHARGAWTAMLDADDLCLPERLAVAAEARAQGFEFFCSAMVLIDYAYRITGLRGMKLERYPRTFPHSPLCGDTALLRQIGYPAHRRGQDQTMVHTLANTRHGRFDPRPLYVYHEDAGIGPRGALAGHWAAFVQVRALARRRVLRRNFSLLAAQAGRGGRILGLLPFLLWPRGYQKTLGLRKKYPALTEPLPDADRAFIAECARLFPMKNPAAA
jgi:glycosyltransferase involved in cell wall biosynthesis